MLLAAFLLSLIPIAVFILTAGDSFGIAPAATAGATRRSGGLIQAMISFLAGKSAFAPLVSIAFALFFASTTLALLYYSFEKTQAPEVLFFALFAFSFVFEAFRLAVPLAVAREWPPAFIVGAARTLVFGRFFGLLSLFASSVYASGVDFQKHGRVLLISAASSLAIATGVPVDGLSWDSALSPIPGYAAMLDLVELALCLIACLSFLVAAKTRGAQEFAVVAAGCVLVCVGRDGLIRGDNWVALPLAVSALAGGTWLLAVKVHRYYLWL